MSGLKRYNIINDDVLKRGVSKLNAYLDEQKREPTRVEAIRGHGRAAFEALRKGKYLEFIGAPAGNRTRT